jgi:hypothetical protein
VTSESASGEERGWLVEPLQDGEIRISVQIQNMGKLSPQIREALENLASALEEDEIQGYAMQTGMPGMNIQQVGAPNAGFSKLGNLMDCNTNCSPNCNGNCFIDRNARMLPGSSLLR